MVQFPFTAEPLLAEEAKDVQPLPKKGRLNSLDLVRGVIMVVMSWDHSRDYVSDQKNPANQGAEQWSGPLATYDNSVRLWFSRFVR